MSSGIFIHPSTGNVGIGTTTALYPLQINGNVKTPLFGFHYVPSGNTSVNTNIALTGFNTAIIDTTGGAFSTSTNIFTAPVNGYYSFSVNVYSNSASAQFTIRKNAATYLAGTELGGAQAPNLAGYSTLHTTILVPLNTNDYITLFQRAGTIVVGTNPASSYCGYLVTPI